MWRNTKVYYSDGFALGRIPAAISDLQSLAGNAIECFLVRNLNVGYQVQNMAGSGVYTMPKLIQLLQHV